MIKYSIKQVIVDKPVIELPVNSQAVSVKHHSAYYFKDTGIESPECWQVVYLEPIKEE